MTTVDDGWGDAWDRQTGERADTQVARVRL